MKEKVFSVVVTVLMITGCGSDQPQDVAEKFVKSLSGTDIKTAESISTDQVKEQLERLLEMCTRKTKYDLYQEALEVVNQIADKTKKDRSLDQKVDKLIKDFEVEAKKYADGVIAELKNKYGTKENVPQEVREKTFQKVLAKGNTLIAPKIKEMFEILDIKTEHPEEMREIIGELYMKRKMRGSSLKKIVKKYVKGKGKVTPSCVDQFTDFGMIDDIDFIETKKDSPDKATVRFEILHKNGKADKVSVEVEQIQKEWRVSNLPLNNDRLNLMFW